MFINTTNYTIRLHSYGIRAGLFLFFSLFFLILSTASSSHQYVGRRLLVKLKNLYTVKLDRTNYFSWKAQMMTHLRGNGPLRFIESEVKEDNTLVVQQDQLLL